MIELVWSPRAIADVEEIRTYIASDSPAWADLTVRRLVASVERLRQYPDSGRMVPERQSVELREVVSGKFRIVYRRRPDLVDIATVFRGSRDAMRCGRCRKPVFALRERGTISHDGRSANRHDSAA